MALCERCRQEIVRNHLGGDDLILLERLRDLGARSAPQARRQEDILNGMEAPLSINLLRESRIRLCTVGFVRAEQQGKALALWITEDGDRALAQFVQTESIRGRNV